jgi:hypothetical protein
MVSGKGGKREGAGRPIEINPATKLATVKMTPTQHKEFLELGGSRWVKRLINESLSTAQSLRTSVNSHT